MLSRARFADFDSRQIPAHDGAKTLRALLAPRSLGRELVAATLTSTRSAWFGSWVLAVSCVETGMFRAGHQLKVLRPIVQAVLVSMMDNLMWLQRAAEQVTHHKSVLWNISVLTRIWVFGCQYAHVAMADNPPAVPGIVVRSLGLMPENVQALLTAGPQSPTATSAWRNKRAAAASAFDSHTVQYTTQTNTKTGDRPCFS